MNPSQRRAVGGEFAGVLEGIDGVFEGVDPTKLRQCPRGLEFVGVLEGIDPLLGSSRHWSLLDLIASVYFVDSLLGSSRALTPCWGL